MYDWKSTVFFNVSRKKLATTKETTHTYSNNYYFDDDYCHYNRIIDFIKASYIFSKLKIWSAKNTQLILILYLALNFFLILCLSSSSISCTKNQWTKWFCLLSDFSSSSSSLFLLNLINYNNNNRRRRRTPIA